MMESNFDCDLCKQKTTTKQSLKHHKEAVHVGAKFECDVCKHEVNSNQMLKLHEARKHHGSKV